MTRFQTLNLNELVPGFDPFFQALTLKVQNFQLSAAHQQQINSGVTQVGAEPPPKDDRSMAFGRDPKRRSRISVAYCQLIREITMKTTLMTG
jgi:hypothetical protein